MRIFKKLTKTTFSPITASKYQLSQVRQINPVSFSLLLRLISMPILVKHCFDRNTTENATVCFY